MRSDRFELPLRIVVQDPFPSLILALQRGATGAAEFIPPVSASPEAAAFELEVTVAGALSDGRPRFLGPYVQGPPTERFVYICVWQAQGEAGSAWNGRIKVPLGGLDHPLIEALPAGARIEGRISGRNRKGGPALATVPILPPGWIHR